MERVEALTREVRALTAQVTPLNLRMDHAVERMDHLAGEIHRRTAWWRAGVAIGIVLVMAIAGGAFLLQLRTRAEIADANRKLCPLVALMIPDVAGKEPTTAYGRQIADQARLLYAAYGCTETNGAPRHA
jgi:anti-sigma-K factor RskA